MVAIFHFLVVVFHVIVVIYRMARVSGECIFFLLFFQGFRSQATAIPLQATGGVNTTPYHAHAAYAIFSRVWLKNALRRIVCPIQTIVRRTEGRSGPLAIQSLLTGDEPNTPVEISSAEVTPPHLPSRRATFCYVYTSSEDATPTPVSLEVDERQRLGMLALPLRVQKREASAALARIYHSTGESSMSSSSHIRIARRPFAMYSQKRKSSRDAGSVQETHSASERGRTEHKEVRSHLKLRADEAAEGEKAASSRLSEAGFSYEITF